MPDEPQEREPATSHQDQMRRHGEPDSSQWQEAESVTGRPNDTPFDEDVEWAVPNTTMAERAAARKRWEAQREKRVDAAENKAIQSSETKRPRKRKA